MISTSAKKLESNSNLLSDQHLVRNIHLEHCKFLSDDAAQRHEADHKRHSAREEGHDKAEGESGEHEVEPDEVKHRRNRVPIRAQIPDVQKQTVQAWLTLSWMFDLEHRRVDGANPGHAPRIVAAERLAAHLQTDEFEATDHAPAVRKARCGGEDREVMG